MEIDHKYFESLKKKLVYIWSDALKSDIRNEKKVFSARFIIKQGASFNLSEDGLNALSDITEEISTILDPAKKNISNKLIEDVVINSIINLLKIENVKKIEIYALEESNNIFQALIGSTKNWSIIVPIGNFHTSFENINIGKVTFFKNTVEFRQKILDQATKIGKKPLEEKIFPNIKSPYLAIINVVAFDIGKAKEKAFLQLNDVLDILRFFALNPIFMDSQWGKNYFDIEGKLQSGKVYSIILQNSIVVSIDVEKVGILYPFNYNDEYYNEIKKDGYEIIIELLNKEDKTEYERNLLSSIQQAANGFMKNQSADRFLHYMISLESLLLDEREAISDNLAERVAITITDNYKERVFFYDRVKDLYKIRCEIVHKGLRDITNSDLFLMRLITYNCIVKLILLYKKEKINNLSEYIDLIRKIKFS